MDYICEEVNKKLENTSSSNEEKVVTSVTVTHEKGLNLRKEANINSEVISAFAKGTVLKIYEIKENWGRTDGGWVCLDYTSYKSNTVNTPKKYTTGRYEVNTEVLTVRKGAGINYDWLRFSQLTSNAQKQVYEKCGYKPNGLCKRCTCRCIKSTRKLGTNSKRLDMLRLLQKGLAVKEG